MLLFLKCTSKVSYEYFLTEMSIQLFKLNWQLLSYLELKEKKDSGISKIPEATQISKKSWRRTNSLLYCVTQTFSLGIRKAERLCFYKLTLNRDRSMSTNCMKLQWWKAIIIGSRYVVCFGF